jgi:hypothetical protein
MLSERWTPVPSAPEYAVSDRGRVWRIGRAPLKLKQLPTGAYLQVALGRTRYRYVHVCVLEAFVGPKPSGRWTEAVELVDE